MTTNSLHRYKIILEYLGIGISGWQRQRDTLSIQEIVENAIYQFSHEKVSLVAAGRTDAGVHALGQVAHFDLSKEFKPTAIINGINHFVRPHKIGVLTCDKVSSEFHARFSALRRHYVYRIINRQAKVTIDDNRVWWIRDALNIAAMREAAQYLIGHHDFNSFRSAQCQAKSPIKTLDRLDIVKVGEELNFYLSAPSFLHHMVRNIVGTLILVGRDKWQPIDVKHALEAKNRIAAGPTAPAQGLYFVQVDY